MLKKKEKSSEEFWKEYEEESGEKILLHSLGRYISGWEEFDQRSWNNIWGLIIAGSKSFRFHHFSQQSWFDVFSTGGSRGSKEKTFSIPHEKISSVKLIQETKWWVKFFRSSSPRILINYLDESGNERQLILEADFKPRELAEKLKELSNQELSGQGSHGRAEK